MDDASKPDICALADELGCGAQLARDMLLLSGGDADLVREASNNCFGAEMMKAYIINNRFRKVESHE